MPLLTVLLCALATCADVKPENIFLSKNLRVVKLGDLGISKQLQEGISLAVTCTGERGRHLSYT